MLIAGRYRIIRELGQGNFGITYKVEDTNLPGNPIRVLKQLKIPSNQPPQVQQKIKEWFEREAENLGKLGTYDQIPNLFDYFQENSQFYLVQEFIEGNTLETELRGKRLSESEVIELLRDILEVVAIVHSYNIIHRDLKPDNLMRRRRDGKLVLIDFGAVKQVKTIINQNVQANASQRLTWGIGTPGYMPNEQEKGHPKLCSDVYAVGMIGIQALTGMSPHLLQLDPNTLEVSWRNSAPVSDAFAAILEKMVRYNFQQRYSNATEVLKAIEALVASRNQANKPSSSPPPPKPKTPSPRPPKNPTVPQLPLFTRRQLIQMAGFGGAGFIGVLIRQRLFNSNSSQIPVVQVSPVETPSPTLPEVEVTPQASPISNQGNNLESFSFEVVTVNERGQEMNRQRSQAKFFEENLGNGVMLAMVSIPGGEFEMGSPPSEEGHEGNESPQHRVNVPPFYMGKYAVTQAQWRQVASYPKVERDLNSNPSPFQGQNLPVENVNWYDAVEFCKRLSRHTGYTYRLPSEAEWEYACRAGTTTPFHFGKTITTDLANFNGNHTYASTPKGVDRGQTTPVGSFPPNAFGLYDMHGNVLEWCLDTWHNNYNGAPTDGSSWIDNENETRLRRGGSWAHDPKICRSAYRHISNPDFTFPNIGFRVCRAAPRTL